MDLEFPGGRGDQVEKSWKFQGVGGNNVKPSGTENPGGWGLKLEKTLRGGGMDIFWNHTLQLKCYYNEILDTHFFTFSYTICLF